MVDLAPFALSLLVQECINDLKSFFFFNDTATTEIYTLSLHDALPISVRAGAPARAGAASGRRMVHPARRDAQDRSEEHTSELQSQSNLVCRLLLEKKKDMHDFLRNQLSLLPSKMFAALMTYHFETKKI